VTGTLIPLATQAATHLQVDFAHSDGVCSLQLVGVLSGDSLHELERHIDVLGGTRFQAVHLDLTGLSGVDDCGRNVLLGLHHYVAARGASWTVSGASPGVASLLHDIPVAWSRADGC
jgi:anti-anti-sigma factor